ncbi:hypothetical protein ACTXT7_016855 [Hymenolepis weldensis]
MEVTFERRLAKKLMKEPSGKGNLQYNVTDLRVKVSISPKGAPVRVDVGKILAQKHSNRGNAIIREKIRSS